MFLFLSHFGLLVKSVKRSLAYMHAPMKRIGRTARKEARSRDHAAMQLAIAKCPFGLLGVTMLKLLPSHRMGQGNRRFCMLDRMLVETLLAKYHLKAVSIDFCRTSSLQWTEH